MLTACSPLRSLALTLAVAAIGCRAQTVSPPTSAASASTAADSAIGTKLSPELARRVEVMIRSRSEVPPQYTIAIGDRTKSEIPGYDQVAVTFSADGKTSKPLNFLVSADGKTLAQFNKFDISQDPKDKVSDAGRPSRGGPLKAPVSIVVFDDLECPYCAQMHSAMFPAVPNRYKDQVHIVYRDFPLSQHPWAIHAAVDANCLAAASSSGYWSYVDYVHAHAAEIGGEGMTLAKADATLDRLAGDEGARQKMNQDDLKACITRQDDSQVKASIAEGEKLGVEATPAVFINGERVDGAIPMQYVYRIIDNALTAAGQTPPPAPAPAAQPAVAAKPGS